MHRKHCIEYSRSRINHDYGISGESYVALVHSKRMLLLTDALSSLQIITFEGMELIQDITMNGGLKLW